MKDSKSKIDIINLLLEDCIMAYPVSSFIISIYQQYQQRGWLTKKQLQGLYGKSSKINGIPPGRLAALEALIKKMPTRYKSELPENKPLIEKNTEAAEMMEEILKKYPAHKRVLYLQARYQNNEILSSTEVDELKKFRKIIEKSNERKE